VLATNGEHAEAMVFQGGIGTAAGDCLGRHQR